jgi:hypothetical protein
MEKGIEKKRLEKRAHWGIHLKAPKRECKNRLIQALLFLG